MTDNLAQKLNNLIGKYTSVFEKGTPRHVFSQQTKNDANIFCYHYQIPDVILYKEDYFDRKECFFITSNTGRQQRKQKKKQSHKKQQLQPIENESKINDNFNADASGEAPKNEEISFKNVDVNDLFQAEDLNELAEMGDKRKNRYRKLSHQNIPPKNIKAPSEKIIKNSNTLPTTNNNNTNIKKNNLENENKEEQNAEEGKTTNKSILTKNTQEHQKKKSFKHNKQIFSKNLKTRKISVDELFNIKNNSQLEGNKDNQKFGKANNSNKRKSSEVERLDRRYFLKNNYENENQNDLQADNFNYNNKRFKCFHGNRYFGRSSSLGYQNFGNYNWNASNYPIIKNFHSFKISNSLNNNKNFNYLNKNQNNNGYFQNAKRDRKLSDVPMKNKFILDNYFNVNPNVNRYRNRLYSNNFNYFNPQGAKASPVDNKLKSNKYDNIKNRVEEKAGEKNTNLFTLWDKMNDEKTVKKKWFIRSQNQINYGPFSNQEIYNYLKTTLTTNPNSELLKNSIIIDSEMDIYFKPDSALEVIQQEIKDISLPPNPKDELEKILIKVNEKGIESQKLKEAYEEESDALQTNANFVLEEKKPIENPEQEEATKATGHKPAEGEFVSAADLYNFIYHHKKLNPYPSEINSNNLKEIGVKSDLNQPCVNNLKEGGNIAYQPAKDDAHINPRMKKLQFPNKENQIMSLYDSGIFQNAKNVQINNPKRIKSFSFADSLNFDSGKFLNKAYNKFDFQNNAAKAKAKECIKKSNVEQDVSKSNNSEKENRRPNVITAIIKPVSIEEIFATDKKPTDINLPNPEILKEIKDFLFNEKYEIKPHDKKEISENQNLKNLMELGITPKIEFRKQSADLFNNKQPLSEKSEGQIKHFLGKKVDGSITRNLNKSKGSSLSNKFDLPLNKICFTRKFSHATTNATKSNPSSPKDSEESPVHSPHPSPILDNETRSEKVLADSFNKNENFKKRRIDIVDIFSKNKKDDSETNKENIDKNLKKENIESKL